MGPQSTQPPALGVYRGVRGGAEAVEQAPREKDEGAKHLLRAGGPEPPPGIFRGKAAGTVKQYASLPAGGNGFSGFHQCYQHYEQLFC